MMVRVWQGSAPRSKISEFTTYVRQELLHSYLKVRGNRGAILLSRPCGDNTEFLLLSFWHSATSLDALTEPDVVRVLRQELTNHSPAIKNYEIVEYNPPDEG